jgi:glyoxylase-like metal-dependent hydrolase (beta-lactamase superfamily II)
MRLIFEQIRLGGDRNFGYLIADREAGQGVLVDPSYAPELLTDRAEAQGVTVTHIVNTHGHADHTNGNATARELTGAPVAAHPDAPDTPDLSLADGAQISVGDVRLTVLHTPGHCPDHLVLYEPTYRLIVTGDLLFVGKVGGTKTEDDARVEWESLTRVLDTVPDETTVWPGHDYGVRPSSTIGLEKHTNPFLRCADVDAFLRLRVEWPHYKQQHGLK